LLNLNKLGEYAFVSSGAGFVDGIFNVMEDLRILVVDVFVYAYSEAINDGHDEAWPG